MKNPLLRGGLFKKPGLYVKTHPVGMARAVFKTGRGLTAGFLLLTAGAGGLGSRPVEGFFKPPGGALSPSVSYEEVLSLSQRGEKGPALALARRLVFENPYHWPAQKFLNSHHLPVFWLQVPTDVVSLILFLLLFKSLWLFYKKKHHPFRLWGTLTLCGLVFSGFYFYHRNFVVHATLTRDQSVLSAPDEGAVVFFKAPEGALVVLKRIHPPFAHIQVSESKGGGWVLTEKLFPVQTPSKSL